MTAIDEASARTDILSCGHTKAQHGRLRCEQVREIEARAAMAELSWWRRWCKPRIVEGE